MAGSEKSFAWVWSCLCFIIGNLKGVFSSGWAALFTALDTLSLSKVKNGTYGWDNQPYYFDWQPCVSEQKWQDPLMLRSKNKNLKTHFPPSKIQLQSWELCIGIEELPTVSGLILNPTAGLFVTVWNSQSQNYSRCKLSSQSFIISPRQNLLEEDWRQVWQTFSKMTTSLTSSLKDWVACCWKVSLFVSYLTRLISSFSSSGWSGREVSLEVEVWTGMLSLWVKCITNKCLVCSCGLSMEK